VSLLKTQSITKVSCSNISKVKSDSSMALEKASHVMVGKALNCVDAFLKEISVSGKRQITYAEELGLGNTEHEIIDLNHE